MSLFLPQFSNTLTHSSHLETSLKTLSRYKFGSCMQNHSWADTSTSSLWNQQFPKCCLATSTNYVSWSDSSAQHIIPTQHTSRHKSCCASFVANSWTSHLWNTGTSQPTTGCHIPEDLLTLLQNLIHTLVSMYLGLLQNCANIAA